MQLQEGKASGTKESVRSSIVGRGEVTIVYLVTHAKLRISRQNCVPISTILATNAKLVINEKEGQQMCLEIPIKWLHEWLSTTEKSVPKIELI
jgi:hypothetical protein